METILKYPRTRHIEGSRIQAGDEDLKNVPFEEIKGRFVVLEEKVDGANCGISFGEGGKLMLQSRGHYLNGGYGERQFDLFKMWANCFRNELYRLLGTRYIMYGEWLYAKHTVYYDELTHYFMEFDLFDREKNAFLSTKKRRELLSGYPFIVSVLVLFEGKTDSLKELASYLGKSHFKSAGFLDVLEKQCRDQGLSFELAKQQTDGTDLMEGIYIKVEEGDYVVDRLKYVRSSFLNTILDTETHWLDRPLIPNRLKPGTDLFAREV
ncbi:DNA ligase [Clostridium sp. chh4-2]|uniref:RNA ligase family protein n=1 Tax=Clostridium sp. chh4-2 TaxID=2067550 RepID=UPI000CCF9D34|nr:RNA ligase family protein [Clostridium sp. chh4-2]PNV62934.1 DNA ligase [Clostridium sp. chh4-2]